MYAKQKSIIIGIITFVLALGIFRVTFTLYSYLKYGTNEQTYCR